MGRRRIELKTVYDQALLKGLAKMQQRLFHNRMRNGMAISGVLLIGAAFSLPIPENVSVLMVLCGCGFLYGVDYPAREAAAGMKKVLKGKYPVIEYDFQEEGIQIRNGSQKEWVSYIRLTKIGKDRRGIYLFLEDGSGYAVITEGMETKNREILEEMIREKTGKNWPGYSLI